MFEETGRRLRARARDLGELERAVRTAICLAAPLAVGLLAGAPASGALASFGGFLGWYGHREPYGRRALLLLCLGLGFVAAVAVGTLAAGSAVGRALAPAAFAAIAAFFCIAIALPPPREYLLVLVCLASTGLPTDPGAWPERAGLAAAGAAFAWLLTMSGWLRDRRRPEPAPAPAPSFAAAERSVAALAAARIGIAIAAAGAIGTALHATNEYWIALTVAAALQGVSPVHARRRAFERAGGTAFGAAFASGLLALGPAPGAIVAIIAVLQTATEIAIPVVYGFGVVILTPIPILLLHVADPATTAGHFIAARVLDTAIGCAIALLALAILWPRSGWARRADPR
jgi:Fusaric acid resistance protein-like